MKERLQKIASALAAVEAQQDEHPGYAMPAVMMAVDAELRRMELKEEPLEYLMEVGR